MGEVRQHAAPHCSRQPCKGPCTCSSRPQRRITKAGSSQAAADSRGRRQQCISNAEVAFIVCCPAGMYVRAVRAVLLPARGGETMSTGFRQDREPGSN